MSRPTNPPTNPPIDRPFFPFALPEPLLHVVLRRQKWVFGGAVSRLIGELPPTANQLRAMHHMQAARLIREWRDLAAWETRIVLAKQGVAWPALPLPQATLLLVRCSCREPDVDGMALSSKCVIDGIVKDAGLVVDDSPAYLRVRYWWQHATQAQQRVKVFAWEGWDVAERLSPDSPRSHSVTQTLAP